MNYNPFRVADWNAWQNSAPCNPMEILASAALQLPPNSPDIGVFLNSTTFAVPTAAVIPCPEVIAASVSSSGPPLETLANMPVEIVPLTVSATNNPDTVDIVFSSNPDPSSLNSSSFVVAIGGSPVAGTISLPFPNTARFTAHTPLTVGTYTVTIHGTGLPGAIVTFFSSTVDLDGDPFQLPSGDGVPGGNFVFAIDVVAFTSIVPGVAANIGGWNPSLFSLSATPYCVALGTDAQQNIADAKQWNFMHGTANLSSSIPPDLSDVVFLRAGLGWQMTIPVNLGTLSYPDIQLSFRNNAGATQGVRGTIPVIGFNTRLYTGNVNLQVVLRCTGDFTMGLRVIDTRGNYFLYESVWRVSC